MKVRLTIRAIFDLQDIRSYIAAHNPAAAERVEETFRTALSVLSVHPYTGRVFNKSGLRRFTVAKYPYVIFYRIDVRAEQIEIATIRHAARRSRDQAN